MRKKKKGRRLSRKTDQRRALLKSLTGELFLREKIATTLAKAKEMRPLAEKMITRAKRDNLANRRHLLRFLQVEVVRKLFGEIGPRYKDRPGGYTRIVRLGKRQRDGAEIALIELVK